MAAAELQRTRRYEAAILPRYDRVAVSSAVDAHELKTIAPKAELTVVPNCVDLDTFRPLACEREPATVIFSGKMSYHANVTAVQRFVREIYPIIRRAQHDVRLRIVGSDPTRAVRDLAQDPTITVTGFVPDLRDVIGTATVAICPVTVKAGTQYKILEAMAMELPVVSTTLGLEGLGAEPERDLLVADGAADFAQRVCALLADAQLRKRLGQAGRQYVETHHRWDDAARKLERLYQEATDLHQAPN
jgi:glycosyltransferase involved in cell wall biosynthesis